MISKSERNKIKKVIGREYSKEVLQILNERGVVNKQNKSHNSVYITKVLNGQNNNEDVEDAIYELVRRKKLAIAKRKSIL
ncbi:MAG: hypothetical protein ABFR05_00220 [Bacteroidota bacterium]